MDLLLVSVDSTTARAHKTPPGCTSIPACSTRWRRPPRRSPGQRGRLRRAKRGEDPRRSRAGRATTHPAPLQTPAEGRTPGTLPGWTDQQGPPRRRSQVPSAGVRPDRWAGRRRPAVHPRTGQGARPRARRPSPHPPGRGRRGQGVLVPRQPRPPAQARHQGRHPGETGPGRQPEEEGPQRATPCRPRRRALQGEEHRRAPDQQAQGVAGHRDPLRQDPGKLPRRASPACLGDLGQRPTRTRAESRAGHLGRSLSGSQLWAVGGSCVPGWRDFGGPLPPGEWGLCATSAVSARGLR